MLIRSAILVFFGNHDGVLYVHLRAYKSVKALLFCVRGPHFAGENRGVLV